MENGQPQETTTQADGTSEQHDEAVAAVAMSHAEILLCFANLAVMFSVYSDDRASADEYAAMARDTALKLGQDKTLQLMQRLAQAHDSLCENKLGEIKMESDEELALREAREASEMPPALAGLIDMLRKKGVDVNVVRL